MDKSQIPPGIRDLPRWVVWQWGPADPRGKRAKRPASPIDGVQKDWRNRPGTLDQALGQVQLGRFDGVGFLPSLDLDVVVIDLDSCVEDGTIQAGAEHIIGMAGTYTEYSPSGTGIRLVGWGNLPTKVNQPGLLEVGQDSNKYFTITGDHMKGTPTNLANYQETLDQLPDLLALLKAEKQVREAPKGTGNDVLYQVTKDVVKQTDLDDEVITTVLAAAAMYKGRRSEVETFKSIESAITSAHEDQEKYAERLKHGVGHDKMVNIAMGLLYNKVRWVEEHNHWIWYVRGRWEKASVKRVVIIVQEALLDELRNRLKTVILNKQAIADITEDIKMISMGGHISRVVDLLAGKAGIITKAEELDTHPWLFNMRNGTLNLRTWDLTPHDPSNLLTRMAGVDYIKGAVSQRFKDHIEKVLPNPRVRRHAQRNLGLALVGETISAYLDMWIGGGSNGKTTTAQIFQETLGEYCIQAAPGLLVRKKFEDHPTGTADLAGSRLVFASELEEGQELNEALVKQLTGGDPQKARFMYGNFFTFKSTYSTILYANNKPIIKGVDTGIWRRVGIVDWVVEIPPEERRPQNDVVRDIMEEGPGVFNWLLEGLEDYLEDPTWRAPEVEASTQAYRDEQDFLAEFLTSKCDFGTDKKVSLSELYQAYVDDCTANSDYPLGKKKFTMAVSARGYRKEKAGGTWTWVGLALNHGVGGDFTIHRNGSDV